MRLKTPDAPVHTRNTFLQSHSFSDQVNFITQPRLINNPSVKIIVRYLRKTGVVFKENTEKSRDKT